MKILGIDPGKKGALVFLSENKVSFYKMPLKEKGGDIDVCKLISIYKEEAPSIAIVEKQFILNWQRGKMAIGANYGRILATLEISGIDHKIITASSWQKKFGLDGDKISHINKAISLGFDVPKNSNRANSQFNDGIADAYLIAKSHTIKRK